MPLRPLKAARTAALLCLLLAAPAAAQPVFQFLHDFQTDGAYQLDSAEFGGYTHLAVANYYDGGTWNIDSEILRWHVGQQQFVPFQSLPTSGATSVEFFSLDGHDYLAVAEYYDGSDYSLDSQILRRDNSSGLFFNYQDIPTSGCIDAEFFDTGDVQLLVLGNYYDGSSYNLTSPVYRWNPGTAQFVQLQSFAAEGLYDVEFVEAGGELFLAVANYYPGYHVDLFRWDPVLDQFENGMAVPYQTIAFGTRRPIRLTDFDVPGFDLLAIAIYYDDSGGNATDSYIYRWDSGTSQFVQHQAWPTTGALDFEYIDAGVDGDLLAIANGFDGGGGDLDSEILAWNQNTNLFESHQLIPTHRARDWELTRIGSRGLLTVANTLEGGNWSTMSDVYAADIVDAPVITLTPPGFALTLTAGESADTSFAVGNAGGITLEVASIVEAADWLSGDYGPVSVPAGEQASFLLQIDAGALSPGAYVEDLLIASNDPEHPDTTLTVDLTVSHREAPAITSIADVPDDQGGWVHLRFDRSLYDDPAEQDTPATGYQVYRREDSAAAQPLAGAGELIPFDHLLGEFPPGEWAAVAWVAATQQDEYLVLLPTQADSSEAGIPWSVHFVTAHTTVPSVWFASEPDSGYSVDNLPPAPPGSLLLQGDLLSWDAAAEDDFAYHSVYGSEVDSLDAAAVLLGHTVETSFDVSGQPAAWYHVTTSDAADNESGAASVGVLTGAADFPRFAFRLEPGSPNPFRAGTSLRFAIPAAASVRLAIYDVSGRRVRTIVDGALAAGEHAGWWDGRDDAGRRLASGLYFSRLEAPGFASTRKLVLLR